MSPSGGSGMYSGNRTGYFLTEPFIHLLRANLGPELVIVNLTLDTEEVRERISSRNPEPSISDALMVTFRFNLI